MLWASPDGHGVRRRRRAASDRKVRGGSIRVPDQVLALALVRLLVMEPVLVLAAMKPLRALHIQTQQLALAAVVIRQVLRAQDRNRPGNERTQDQVDPVPVARGGVVGKRRAKRRGKRTMSAKKGKKSFGGKKKRRRGRERRRGNEQGCGSVRPENGKLV